LEQQVTGSFPNLQESARVLSDGRIDMEPDEKKQNEPENRPKERIELLISNPKGDRNRRVYDRTQVEPGTEVYFPMVCRGEVMDASETGLSIRINPLDSPTLAENQDIVLTMPATDRTFTITASVKRVESRFGVMVIGLFFDPEHVEIEEIEPDPE
jgi:hypothetical protein